MLDELTDSIKARLYDFTVSPLLITFITSWVGWNYRFVLVILSSKEVEDKLAYVDSQLFSQWSDYALRGILWPLITTFLILFVYPFPARYVFGFWRQKQQELVALKKRIDGETPLTKEAAASVLKRVAEVEALLEERESLLSSNRSLVRELREQLAAQEVGTLADKARNDIANRSATVTGKGTVSGPSDIEKAEAVLQKVGRDHNTAEAVRRALIQIAANERRKERTNKDELAQPMINSGMSAEGVRDILDRMLLSDMVATDPDGYYVITNLGKKLISESDEKILETLSLPG
jgi:predicted transcriptional regulator